MVKNSFTNEKGMWKFTKFLKNAIITHSGDCTNPCYWIQWKNEFAQQNINTKNTSAIGQVVKRRIQTRLSCILETWLCKENHTIHILEKDTGNNVTSWIQFLCLQFFCQICSMKLSILTYLNSSFWCIHQYRSS